MKSCKETSQLISESLDRKLSLSERLSIKLHTMRCDLCSRYSRQLRFIKNTCAETDMEQSTPRTPLDEEVRERIRNRLKQDQ